MIAQVEDVADDVLVDAVAKRGRAGVHLHDQSMERLLIALGFDPYSREIGYVARNAACDLRWYASHEFKEWPTLANRLMAQGPTLHLTDEEWAKRLAGKTAVEILVLLKGTP